LICVLSRKTWALKRIFRAALLVVISVHKCWVWNFPGCGDYSSMNWNEDKFIKCFMFKLKSPLFLFRGLISKFSQNDGTENFGSIMHPWTWSGVLNAFACKIRTLRSFHPKFGDFFLETFLKENFMYGFFLIYFSKFLFLLYLTLTTSKWVQHRI